MKPESNNGQLASMRHILSNTTMAGINSISTTSDDSSSVKLPSDRLNRFQTFVGISCILMYVSGLVGTIIISIYKEIYQMYYKPSSPISPTSPTPSTTKSHDTSIDIMGGRGLSSKVHY